MRAAAARRPVRRVQVAPGRVRGRGVAPTPGHGASGTAVAALNTEGANPAVKAHRPRAVRREALARAVRLEAWVVRLEAWAVEAQALAWAGRRGGNPWSSSNP